MSIATTAKTVWDKVIAWARGEVLTFETALSAEEHAVLAVVRPILHNAEVVLLSDVIAEARVFLSGVAKVGSLADLESALLNVWETEKPALFSFAKGLGSNIFQAIIGLLLSQLPKAL